ncbi:MAG: dTMP kinase [Ignavibacteria bacterium CG2_30_36_16]|nr:dTMP kinase [Ignavibacteria bacterium]OIP63018.1 MAG: dTMP kinase [Ignavibacteria bacterium CG2_30_36_16]PJB01816.1 MAG: dTMP kinase [Ignavibacteria bacterium CG_4_9_14_3_um_filter_36_18]
MFITFEGIDFCGKSTQVELLKKYLEQNDHKIVIIREPGGTEISEKVRDILLDKKNNMMFIETEILLFAASRSQLVREKIRPFLNENYYVISDRFHDSTTAYQGYGRGLPVEIVNNIHNLSIGETIPDITFFIDIPVEEAERRKAAQGSRSLDRIEVSANNFYEKVRRGYLEIAARQKRFKVINGMMSIEEIHKQILNEINLLHKKELN